MRVILIIRKVVTMHKKLMNVGFRFVFPVSSALLRMILISVEKTQCFVLPTKV